MLDYITKGTGKLFQCILFTIDLSFVMVERFALLMEGFACYDE